MYSRPLSALTESASTSSNAANPNSDLSSAAATLPSTIESTQSALSLLRSQATHYVVASIAGRTLVLHARDVVTLPRLNDVEIGDVIELDRIHEVGSRDYTLRAQSTMNARNRGPAALTRTSTNSHQRHLLEVLQEAIINPLLPQVSSTSPILEPFIDSKGNVKESQSWAARLKPGGLAHVGSVLDKSTVRVRCTVVEHTKGRMEFIVKKKRRKGYKKTIKHKQTYTRLRVEGIQLGGD